MSDRFAIPADKLQEVRLWFKERGGAIRWRNLEIGVMRDDQLTPANDKDGNPYGKPHWSYGDPSPVQPDEIDVREETAVAIPLAWFKKPCERCQGTGRLSLHEFTKPRNQTIAELIASPVNLTGIDVQAETCDCFHCDGTGKAERSVKVRIRRHWWGYDISETGKAKADRLARKLGPDVKWEWKHEGYGLASLRFYRETVVPFTID